MGRNLKSNSFSVRFEVLEMIFLKIQIFWGATMCRLVNSVPEFAKVVVPSIFRDNRKLIYNFSVIWIDKKITAENVSIRYNEFTSLTLFTAKKKSLPYALKYLCVQKFLLTFYGQRLKAESSKLNINLLKTKSNLLYLGIRSYRVVNTFHHGYKNQPVNDLQSKSRCLFWYPYKTLNAKRAPCRIF